MTSNDWPRVRLAELSTKVGSGSTPRGGEDAYKSSGTPLIRSMNVVFFGFKREGLAFIDDAQADSLRGAEVHANDVLLNITGASIGRVTLAPEDLQGSRVNQHVCIIRPTEALDPRYLRAFLSSPEMQAQINSEQYGVTRQALTKEQILGFEVPLAPPAEQKRIADKLDALLARVKACRDRLDRVPGILKRFRQSVLAAATSGELTREWREERGDDGATQTFQLEDAEAIRDYTFPASWTTARLSDVAAITGGVTKDSKKQSAHFTELPYLRVANVQRGYLDLTEMKTIRVPPDRVNDLLLHPGDILFNEGGDIDKLGRGWVWDGQLPACVFQNHVFRARLHDPRFAPRYFSWYGNSRGYDYFLAHGKQTTNLASINKSVLSALPVAVPPADEQEEIVRRLDALFQFADRLDRNFQQVSASVLQLSPAILAKAFSGELVPQDPNDTPASELLAQIRRDAEPQSKTRPGRTGKRPLRKIIRTGTNMLTRKDVSSDHLTSILKQRGPLEAQALWAASQMGIDEFYDQLKEEEAQKLLREKRSDGDKAARLLEAVS